jgi:hypothetical protein
MKSIKEYSLMIGKRKQEAGSENPQLNKLVIKKITMKKSYSFVHTI